MNHGAMEDSADSMKPRSRSQQRMRHQAPQ